ncbi:MAG: ribosome maturation factor RimM [Pseudomonadota bacterium]
MAPKPGRHDESFVVIAEIAGPHGVRGDAKLKTFTDDPMTIARFEELWLAEDKPPVGISDVRGYKTGALARLAHLGTPEAIKEARGTTLMVPRSALPEPEDEEEYYYTDLIGLRVEDETARIIGEVTQVEDFGAGDILTIRSAQSRKLITLPFTKAMVPTVDLSAGRLVIDAQAAEPYLNAGKSAEKTESQP